MSLYSRLSKTKNDLIFALVITTSLLIAAPVQADVKISVEEGLLESPFNGKVYVVIAPVRNDSMPLKTNYWFQPLEILSKDVKNWDGRSIIKIDRDDTRYLKKSNREPKGYELQVLFRVNGRDANPFKSPGNLYSDPVKLDSKSHQDLNLTVSVSNVIDKNSSLYPSKPTKDDQLRLFSHTSSLLSKFHKQDYSVDVAVRLPKDWMKNTTKKWPVLYYISGMGGSEVEFLRMANKHKYHFDKMIAVSVNAMNFGGHSVFADSENTGPWASMLVEEIVPMIDSKYRGAGANKRYLTGISSGGWSSLWLQVKFPNEFASTWSFVPDPVDFRDFQRVNLYADNQNLYANNLGEERLVARTLAGKPLIKYKDFIQLESALGDGGQIRSFEYVFSPRGEDGLPMKFFNRETGEIDTKVTEHWKEYDIRLYLKKNWSKLKDKLNGKLHVYGGEKDQFFLENAVRLLSELLVKLDADAEIQVISDMGHAFDTGKVTEMLKEITEDKKD